MAMSASIRVSTPVIEVGQRTSMDQVRSKGSMRVGGEWEDDSWRKRPGGRPIPKVHVARARMGDTKANWTSSTGPGPIDVQRTIGNIAKDFISIDMIGGHLEFVS